MVKLKEIPESDKLESLIRSICDKYGLKLFVAGWTRKTYDIFHEDKKLRKSEHMARIESLASTTGEVRFFDDSVTDFVQELGEAIESVFNLKEAILIQEKRPEY